MYRAYLAPNQGMLFHFNPPKKASIWMKNTLIPLDIIWLDHTFKVVDIHPYAIPYSTTVLTPSKKASYILEVNANTITTYQITKGTHIRPFYNAKLNTTL